MIQGHHLISLTPDHVKQSRGVVVVIQIDNTLSIQKQILNVVLEVHNELEYLIVIQLPFTALACLQLLEVLLNVSPIVLDIIPKDFTHALGLVCFLQSQSILVALLDFLVESLQFL